MNEPKPIPWGKFPVFAVWLSLVAALSSISKAGLDSLALPGMESDRLQWVFAVSLTAAESLLIERFRRTGNVCLLFAGLAMMGATLGTEFLNMENAARAARATPAERRSIEAARKDVVRAAELKVSQVETEIAQLIQTRAIWSNDGDRSNDGALEAAESARVRAVAELSSARNELEAAAGQAGAADASKGAVAEIPPLLTLLGLFLVKLGAVALAWVLGSSENKNPVPPKQSPPGDSPSPPKDPPSVAPSRPRERPGRPNSAKPASGRSSNGSGIPVQGNSLAILARKLLKPCEA